MKCNIFRHLTKSCLTNEIGIHGKMHKSITEGSLDPIEERIAESTGISTRYIPYEMQLFWREASIHVEALCKKRLLSF